MRSEIRRDYIQEKYVIIAPRRAKRHHLLASQPRPLTATTCFFCPENIQREEIIQLIGPRTRWDFAVLKNKFPAVSPNNPQAYGWQEIIVETSHPWNQLEDLPAEKIAKLLKLYGQRVKDITKNKKIKYVIIFKNNGGSAGATITHSHSQIFATNFIPPQLQDKSERVLAYRLKHGACVYCDVIKKERRGPRLIAERQGIITFAPYASMYNYEVWLLPRRHLTSITELNETERRGWAYLLQKILMATNRLGLPYNFYFHENVFDKNVHLYMKITPRGSVWAGVEIGSGVAINAVAPEEAAKYYRSAFRG